MKTSIRVGSRVRTREGTVGTITEVHWRAVAGSMSSYISKICVRLDDGRLLDNMEASTVEIESE